MSDLTITLPDGSSRTLPEGSTGLDLATDIGPGLAKAAVIVSVDGEGCDLDRVLAEGDSGSVVTADSDEGLPIRDRAGGVASVESGSVEVLPQILSPEQLTLLTVQTLSLIHI